MRLNWLVLLILANPYAVALEAQSAVPIYLEPRHQLVLEAGPIRVLDVQIPAGDTTLFHIHDTAILYTPISSSTMLLQPFGGEWSVARLADSTRAQYHETWSDTLYVKQPLTHRVANAGTNLFRLIAVTNSRTSPTLVQAAGKSDVPGAVEQNSSWFLQSRITTEPGSTSAWYTSQLPMVIVQPTAGHSLIDYGPPSVTRGLAGAGAWHYLPADTRFRFRNPGVHPVMLVLVQVR